MVIELESVKTRISAPAHPSATGIGRVSGLVQMTVYKTILLSTPPDISSFMTKYCKGNDICEWKKIHKEEILNL